MTGDGPCLRELVTLAEQSLEWRITGKSIREDITRACAIYDAFPSPPRRMQLTLLIYVCDAAGASGGSLLLTQPFVMVLTFSKICRVLGKKVLSPQRYFGSQFPLNSMEVRSPNGTTEG